MDKNSSEEKNQRRKEERLWAWVLSVAIVLPVVMHPGNLGPIAIIYGLLLFSLPAFYVGSFLGRYFWPPQLIYRLFLVILAIVSFLFMLDSVKT